MRPLRGLAGVTVSIVAVAAAATGCTTTAGTPTAETVGATSTSSSAVPEPAGTPVGTAVMKVIGGSTPVTIRYRINGGAQKTETGVTLPWEKQYPVYNEVESEVAADGGSTPLTCTITMDGDKLVSFKTEVNPVCNFSYWG